MIFPPPRLSNNCAYPMGMKEARSLLEIRKRLINSPDYDDALAYAGDDEAFLIGLICENAGIFSDLRDFGVPPAAHNLLTSTVFEFEKRLIITALDVAGNIKLAARLLRMPRSSLMARMDALGVDMRGENKDIGVVVPLPTDVIKHLLG